MRSISGKTPDSTKVLSLLFRSLTKALPKVLEASQQIKYNEFVMVQRDDEKTIDKWENNVLKHLFYDLSTCMQRESLKQEELKEQAYRERKLQTAKTADVATNQGTSKSAKRRERRRKKKEQEEKAFEASLSLISTLPCPPLPTLPQ
jgi:hypothetical protein